MTEGRPTARTATSNFGVGKRESHDASGFYRRFEDRELSTDSSVPTPRVIEEPFIVGDARQMSALNDGEVALVVTSPPYFAGKQYELEVERDGIPSSYTEYLTLLAAVFDDCKRVLEPGGRIAVNIANLGRKPYRSLAADVIGILERLGLLLRGEVIWQKGEGASGSCAWGSYRSAANPVLRDTTERVIVASKGRFDRALSPKHRKAAGLPWESTISADEFVNATLDVWHLHPESARRVGHPAPFPTGLPERLIQMYTFRNDLVLDPFLGSGSTLVAASRIGRRYIGYDLDAEYVAMARERVRTEGVPTTANGAAAKRVAATMLSAAGFHVTKTSAKIRGAGVVVDLVAQDTAGREWFVDVHGTFTTSASGLQRTDTVWKALGQAAALERVNPTAKRLWLTVQMPTTGSEADRALRILGPATVFDVITLGSPEGQARLASYSSGQVRNPLPGFWSTSELVAELPNMRTS